MWSAIYILDRGWPGSVPSVLAKYPYDLAVGRYHLYFLLVTLQLYAVFPWVLPWVRRVRRPAVVLTASLLAQLVFTAAVHDRAHLPGIAGTWLAEPTSWLISYQLYVVAGILAALHLDALRAWVRQHRRGVSVVVAASGAAGVATYFVSVAHGATPIQASAVFQPAVTVESVAAIAGLYALGIWYTDRASARRLRTLERTTDVSFGVYLAHPLVLQALWSGAGIVGARRALESLPGPIAVALVLGALVPLAYVVTAALVTAARRTPLSVALTGRPRREKPSLAPAPSVVPAFTPTPALDAAVLS
jgi:peptidoglycan/LPS O-acetylase OafA/YrhL